MKTSRSGARAASQTTETTTRPASFDDLGLAAELVAALRDVGYEVPTPIQSRTIPLLLGGRDVIGQAQTGTGKTAAFALPLLQSLDLGQPRVQALVLTPTRELAIQVAEAIHTYAKHLGAVRAVPIYGGEPIQKQLAHLRRGVHAVIGTPGRIMDHLRRGTLDVSALRLVVLDEADEMLRMGFIDDVEWILGQIPGPRQTALFSATMPDEIRRIADRHLASPANVEVEHRTLTVPTVEQGYLHVAEHQKLDALTRLLEAEATEGVLVFTRTKTAAADVGERLKARGYSAEAMHGDMTQPQRERVIRRLRSAEIEILVATDVAARGLDVRRISHVVNYDMPYDAETYVHRIGRTARAGRSGRAVLFVTPRETRMLREIEQFTRQRLQPMTMPTAADIAARRRGLLKDQVRELIAADDNEAYLALVEELAAEGGFAMVEIAAAAARLAHGEKSIEVTVEPAVTLPVPAEDGMVRLFIDAGRQSGVRPADIVGAIAGEADIPGRAIGSIDIYDRFTFVEIPAQYRDRVLERMAGTTLRSRPIRVTIARPGSTPIPDRASRPRGDRRRTRRP